MYHPVKNIQDFTKSLAGLWLNPRTKNQFFFTADKSGAHEGGEIRVLQKGAKEPVALHFDLSASNEKIYMFVEGEQYKISLRNIPSSALYIQLSPDRTLRLLKQ